MKVLLTTLNAKYIHSSLALRYIKAYCEELGELEIKEFTINQQVAEIAAQVYDAKPDVVGFACYLWNIEMTLKIAGMLRQVLPHVTLICGGPEVTYLTEGDAAVYHAFDYIVRGEGEQTFYDLLEGLHGGGEIKIPSAVAFCKNGRVQSGAPAIMRNLDMIAFPYQSSEIEALKDRILYYESSRGCPFSCAYCLSSATDGVRFFSLERVIEDLQFFIARDVRQVKFVDRTFNARKEYFIPIWEFISRQQCRTNFHFEIAVDLLDDEALTILERMPPGRVQLEIGIQSTHELTLREIRRKNHWDKIVRNVNRLMEMGNIHLHLDLIIGLPYESYQVFGKSFNDVFALRPHMLQIGFLKRLKGSGIANCSENHGYGFMEFAPYEVLFNNDLTYAEIRKLHIMEEIFEFYYNAGRFKKTLSYLVSLWGNNAFRFFTEFTEHWRERELHLAAHTTKALYKHLFSFCNKVCPENIAVIGELLKFDALLADQGKIRPEYLQWDAPWPAEADSAFWREGAAEKYIPEYQFTSWRDVKKQYHIEWFSAKALQAAGCPSEEKRPVLFFLNSMDGGYTIIDEKDFCTGEKA